MKAVSGKKLCKIVEKKGWILKKITDFKENYWESSYLSEAWNHANFIDSRTWK